MLAESHGKDSVYLNIPGSVDLSPTFSLVCYQSAEIMRGSAQMWKETR